ncbi:crossover junction endodeoxyribonuclease RuvC [bacterium]|nr:crossover junction endodeoxyribonuclease RuvC [bacterium]
MRTINIQINRRTTDEVALGVDPGSRTTGIGLVRSKGARLVYVDHLPINIPAKLEQSQKLVFFAEKFQDVLDQFAPSTMAIESLFTARNVRSILKLSHIRGVAMMMAAKAGWAVVEIAPATVKQAVTGYGRATKEQVQYMVQKILQMSSPPKPFDCADALALAICHLNQSRLLARIKK